MRSEAAVVVSDRRADAVRRVVNDLIRTHNPPK
jgi:hypothetical protein